MIESALKWLLPRLAHRVILVALLLLIATLSAINGLNKALPQLDNRLMVSLSLLSFGLSWGLAHTRLTARAMGALMVSSGIALLLFYLGNLALPSLKLLLGLSDWLNQIRNTANFDSAPLHPAWQEFSHTLSLLMHRLSDWAQAIFRNSPTFDSLIFQLVWGLTSWLGTAWAVWWLRRYDQPLPAILPLGGLLVITCAYRLTNLMPLASLLMATLLLQALITYHHHETQWQYQGLDFSRELQKDVAFAVVPIVLLLMLIATFIPSLSLSFITIPAQQWLYAASPEINPLANLLGIKPAIKPNNNTVNAARLGGLPRHHLIDSSPELSYETVMLIQVSTPATATRPLYWRALTYDTYTGHGWLTGAVDTMSYDKEEATPLTPTDTQQILTQQVQMIGSDGFLYVTGDVLKVNAAYQVAWRDSGDIFATATTAKRYQADSLISTATADQLRAAPVNYPSDITNRYLDLPDDLPPRVITLAHDLTITAPTQYDRAVALESYLRTFTYTLNVPTPPLNQDLVDYFLFDLKKGYCDYYATSMVVMARSIGLPARLVVGYAPGSYLPVTRYYVVTAAEAHSWAEIYFPGYGWQEFEPTGGSRTPPPARPQTAMSPSPVPYTSTATVMPPRSARASFLLSWFIWLGYGLLEGLTLFMGSGIILFLADYAYLRYLSPQQTIQIIFRRLEWLGQRFFQLTPLTDTPYEFVTHLSHTLPPELQAYNNLQQLAELYVRLSYGSDPITSLEQHDGLQLWRHLRWQLLWAWLSQKKKGVQSLRLWTVTKY